MVPARYRRLWKRRLRRRPLLPLAIAATLALDLVLVLSKDLADYTGGGFLVGQLALVAIWVTHSWRLLPTRLLSGLAVLLGLVAAYAVAAGMGPDTYVALTAMTGVFAGQLLAAGLVHHIASRMQRTYTVRRGFRFSVGSLLVISTVAAVLAVIVRLGDWPLMLADLTLLFSLGDALICGLCLALYRFAPSGPSRLLLFLATPVFLCSIDFFVFDQMISNLAWFYAMQSATILLGLSLMKPLGVRRHSSAEATEEPLRDEPSTDVLADRLPATLPMRIDLEA